MAFLKKSKHNTLFYGWPVLLVGTLITCAFTYYSYVSVVSENHLRLDYDSDEIVKQIEYKMNQYEELLLQTRGFFLSSHEVTRKEFAHYVENLSMKERHPEIQAIGFGVRVKSTEVPAYLDGLRKTIPSYNIWPETLNEEKYPIVYLEPFDEQNQRAIGYDSFSERNRREALSRAFKTGQTSISKKVYLVQDDIRLPHPGLILYHSFINSVPEYFFTAFRAETLFRTIFNGKELPLDVEIFAGTTPSTESLIYDHDGKFHPDDRNTLEKSIKLYGQDFLLKFRPSAATKNKSVYKAPVIVFVIGMVFAFLIFRIFGITKKSQTELSEALESRDEFISIASHELKTPLTAIKLHTQMVKRNASKIEDSDARRKLYADHIDHTEILSQRLERLVDDMLDISRIKTARLSVFKELVDMNNILDEAIQRLKDQFRVIPGAKPVVNYGINTTGIWDKHRIDQVITNLLTNAIKYGEGKAIEVTTSSTPTTVKISVKDHGIGIAPEFHDKIFDRFERAGINSRGISGLGLGLYITHQIIQLHGGTITVESKVGEGSTFIVELPKTS